MLSTKTDREDWRRRADEATAELSRLALIAVLVTELLDWRDEVPRSYVLASARRELVRRYPCNDCGADAGAECRPDYGCQASSRRPKRAAGFFRQDLRCLVDESAGQAELLTDDGRLTLAGAEYLLADAARRDDDERRAAEGDEQRDYAEERAQAAAVREENEAELQAEHVEKFVARRGGGFVAWCECGVGSPVKPSAGDARASLMAHIRSGGAEPPA